MKIKKRPNSEAFFRKTYAPVLARIEERRADPEKDRLRALNSERMRRYRATKPKLSPEQLLEIRRKNMAAANASKTPEQHRLIGLIAAAARKEKMTPEKRRKMREAGVKNIRAHNERVGIEALRRQQQASVISRLKISAEWPFPPPRLTPGMKKRIAEGRDAIIDPKTHEPWFAAHPDSQFSRKRTK